MRVLVACEFSGIVRDAFAARGHSAFSCDLLPSERPGFHLQGDAREAIRSCQWDLMIAHPPCTHLSVSGARHFKHKSELQRQALDFVRELMAAPIPRIAVENPVSVIGSAIRPCDQVIQPWEFGHEAQKTTCLWLKNLPLLRPTKIVGKGEFTVFSSGRKHPKWYADAKSLRNEGWHTERSRTFRGIGEAMAEQWGSLNETEGIQGVLFQLCSPQTFRSAIAAEKNLGARSTASISRTADASGQLRRATSTSSVAAGCSREK